MNSMNSMDVDIEKNIEYEIKCDELIQQMFTTQPVGPGGDSTWAITFEMRSAEIIKNKKTDIDDWPFVDFMKYDKPTLICGCSSRGGEDLQRVTTRNTCFCWKTASGKHESYLRKILNTIRTPYIFKDKQGSWQKQISSEPFTRKDILEINETLDMHLDKQLAQVEGVCPVRRHLFSSLFDEIIRQEMIISVDRGLLLMRVKDELKMSLMAYEALYEQGLNYGMLKRFKAERVMNDLKLEYSAILQQTTELKNKIKALHEEFKDQKMHSELAVRAVRHRAKLEYSQLHEIKQSLQAQLNDVIPDIEKIEKERRLRNLL